MSTTSLILGPILFQDFEVPERVNFGGGQRLAVHRLAGGARVVDTLGRDDAEISFTGIFSGPDASLRARAVDMLRALGTPQLLTWDVFAYTVVVREFHAEYRVANWILFRIVCTVLRDEAAVLVDAPLAMADAVLGDLGLAAVAGISMAGVVQALAVPNAGTRGSSAHAAAERELARARAGLDAGMARAEGDLPAADIADAATLNRASEAMGALADFATARAHAGRAGVNLANAST